MHLQWVAAIKSVPSAIMETDACLLERRDGVKDMAEMLRSSLLSVSKDAKAPCLSRVRCHRSSVCRTNDLRKALRFLVLYSTLFQIHLKEGGVNREKEGQMAKSAN